MTKLDDILKQHREEKKLTSKGLVIDETGDAFTKQQIKDLFMELIGKEREWDTSEPYDNPDIAQGYNEAITELREKVENL